MNKKRFKKYLLFGFLIFLIAGIFANYSLGDSENSIEESYSKGANIQGWINMSFDNENANSLFSDSNGNSIRLIDLLKTDSNYECDPDNCESFYSSTSLQQPFILIPGQEKLIGFKLNSDMSSIEDFSLTIESDAPESSVNQLKIDLFNDGINDLGNTKIGLGDVDRDYGCFYRDDPSVNQYTISSMYCQRIHLPEAPGFEVGAWIKKESGSLDLKMGLYKEGVLEDFGESCFLTDSTSQGGTISCDINYLVTKEADYYVCLYESTESYGGGIYKIKAYPDANGCGFFGSPSQGTSEVAAYRIFAGVKNFGDFGILEITDQLPNGDSVSFSIDEYIQDKYDNLSCLGRNCIIPIKLISGIDQEILTISGKIKYIDETVGGAVEETIIYDLSETSALITADYQKIYLDKANFSAPNEIGKYNFILNFDGTELFSKEVEVKKGVSINSISPVKTAASLPTTFKVRLDIPENITITEYKWDFGDGTNKTTFTNEVINTYDEKRSYLLTITVEDSEGTRSSSAFNIEVGSAKDVLDDLITEKQEDLVDIQEQLLTYDLFSISAIENVLDLNKINEKLTNLSSNYLLIKDIGTEQDYQELLSKLLEIDLPRSISQTLSFDDLVFYPKKENIDLDMISLIAGGDYGDLYDEYQDSVLGWNINNIQTTVSVKEFSTDYGGGEEILVKVFEVKISDSQETSYLFIEDMENLQFKENKSSESGFYYEELSGNEIVEFYTTQDIDFEDLPLFISPSLSSLSVVAGGEPEKAGKKFKWGLFLIILLFIILIGIGIYFFLKKWYEEKYENYLFKNKNDLYNMVLYIQNAKKQGKDDNSIAKDLRKAKWSNEQISYIMKKYAGKKTGMPSFVKKSIPQQKIGNSPRKRRF